MDQYDLELLDKQMGKLTPRPNDGAVAILVVATGVAIGGVLSAL